MKIPKGSQEPNLTLGVRLTPGSDDTHFCKPTDVAVASNGDFFVSDGYVSYFVLILINIQWHHFDSWSWNLLSMNSVNKCTFSFSLGLVLDIAMVESWNSIKMVNFCTSGEECLKVKCISYAVL